MLEQHSDWPDTFLVLNQRELVTIIHTSTVLQKTGWKLRNQWIMYIPAPCIILWLSYLCGNCWKFTSFVAFKEILTSWRKLPRRYKLIGVLNAAMTVKNMVQGDESDTSVSTSTSSRVSDLNTSLKDAENLLHLVLSCTAKSHVAAALFMDEMASIILKEGMHSKLEVRLWGVWVVNFSCYVDYRRLVVIYVIFLS